MKLLLNIDILADYLCAREPHASEALRIALLGKLGEIELWCSSTQVEELLCLLTGGGTGDTREAQNEFRKLREFVGVSIVGVEAMDRMAASAWDDLDAELVYEAALEVKADAIVTQHPALFEKSSIPVVGYEELFSYLQENLGVRYEAVAL